jgi:two-component system OmpR family response regulator
MARVLIVDDETDGAEAVCRFLRKGGHEAVHVPTGRDALARLSTISPDVVVLDVMMPEMGGMEFLEVLRNYYRGQFIPVILLTALADGHHIRRATHLGVKRIFLKSNYDLADLLACVNELSTPISGAELSAISAQASLNG